MKEIKVEAIYQCGFCNKKHWMKGVITRHEKICKFNPANKDACVGCVHMEIGKRTIEAEYQYDYRPSYSKSCKTFTCVKLNKEMYPFAADKKKLPEKYPETFSGQERMPTKCELFVQETAEEFWSKNPHI
jgi:hypothetical protein